MDAQQYGWSSDDTFSRAYASESERIKNGDVTDSGAVEELALMRNSKEGT